MRLLAGRTPADDQLVLPLDAAPRTAEELLGRLRALGLRRIDRCRLTRNRTVMVSFRGTELWVHEGYLDAPAEALLLCDGGFREGQRQDADRKHRKQAFEARHRGVSLV